MTTSQRRFILILEADQIISQLFDELHNTRAAIDTARNLGDDEKVEQLKEFAGQIIMEIEAIKRDADINAQALRSTTHLN